ncbi:MAG: phosphatase PAP2 family protein [bacterium]|nr:phosphatase PAP2 family protein [bacterium]
MKKYLKWIVAIIPFTLFIILFILVINKKDMYLDSFVYSFISKLINDKLSVIVKLFTHMASTYAVISITLLVLLILKNKYYGLFLSIDLIITTILQIIIKNICLRQRPIGINLITQSGYSFPSGHSLTAFTFYGLIIYFIYKSNLNKKLKYILIIILSLVIFMVGLSRMYLGVHYFTDVIAGYTLGLSFLIIYINFIKSKRVI